MVCKTCNKEYTPDCDFNQGRCPSHPPMINIQPKEVSKGHFYVSLAKSGIRIVAGLALCTGNLTVAGVLVILAEVLGIVEELV